MLATGFESRIAVRLLAAFVVLVSFGASGCSCGSDKDDITLRPVLCVSPSDSDACGPDGSDLDWGQVPVGAVTMLTLQVTNTAPAGANPLQIDAIRITDDVGGARLFDVALCQPDCATQVLGFPAALAAGTTAQLVLSFDATERDGLVPLESLEIVSNGSGDQTAPDGIYVRPFTGEIDGCLEGRLDANDDLTDGCECAPSVDGQEYCDGLDNDCNGMIDEGVEGAGIACNTGLPGECGPGSVQCVDAALACVSDQASTPEVCDGLDNDCDGPIDEENSWVPFNEGLTGGNMGAVQFDPRSPGVVYATTGARVYRSSDGGASFAPVGEAVHPITAFGFPANDPGVILAAAIGGLIRSEDDGVSWKEVSLSGFVLTTILVHPADPAHIYVGTNGGGIFRSTNSGEFFSTVNEGIPYGAVSSLEGALDDVNTVVASFQLYTPQSTFNGQGAILKTVNGGANWVTTLTGVGRILRLSACASDSDVMYGASYYTGVVQSLDGGSSWVTAGLPNERVTGVGVAPSDCMNVYAATEVGGTYFSDDGGASFSGPMNDGLDTERPGDANLRVDPTATTIALLANHSGIFRTTNSASTWVRVGGIDAAQVRDLGVSPAAPDRVWMATWGQGPWVRSGSANDWERVPTSVLPRDFAFTLTPDPADVDRIGVGAFGDFWQSEDSGTSFTLAPGPVNVMTLSYHPTDANVVYVGTQVGGVWKSVDGGQTYTEASDGMDAPWDTGVCVCRDVRALVVDALTPDTLYAGTNQRGLWRSSDAGASWEGIAPALSSESIRCLVQDAGGDLLACVEGQGIWRSSDQGDSFTKLTQNLSFMNNVSSIYLDAPTGDIYAASDNGVYRSDDDGASWDGMDNACLPPSGVGSPVILDEGGQRTLLVGTGGVGVYALRLE